MTQLTEDFLLAMGRVYEVCSVTLNDPSTLTWSLRIREDPRWGTPEIVLEVWNGNRLGTGVLTYQGIRNGVGTREAGRFVASAKRVVVGEEIDWMRLPLPELR